MDEAPPPTPAKLRKLLGELLQDASDFDAFCHDRFPNVHRRFSDGMNRVARETLLLQHADLGTLRAALVGTSARDTSTALPPNNLPLRNRNFVGRAEALEALHAQLGATSRVCVVPRAVFGLGGLGKSSFALEYAHRHTADYSGGLWWVRAEGGPVEALLALAADLRAAGPDPIPRALARISEQAPTEEVARAVVLALQNHPAPTLLILDNVASVAWRDHLPGGAVRVLVTTRDRALLPSAVPVVLGVLSDDEARELADQLAGNVADARECAARDRVLHLALGNLPVAVEVAARAVSHWHLPWSAYERLLAERPVDLMEDEDVRGVYPRGVFAALDLSIERVEGGTSARRLLEGAAVFAPDAIPRDWAAQAAGLGDELALPRAVSALEALGLLKVDRGGAQLALHRLVRQRVRAQAERGGTGQGHGVEDPGASDEGWDGTRRRGIACVREWIAATVDSGRIAEVDARRAHVEELLEVAESADPVGWIVLAERLATHLWHRGDRRNARELFERVLLASESAFGPDHQVVATHRSNLALVLHEQGYSEAARLLLERALRTYEASFGPNHTGVATCLSNLALVLRAMGNLIEARSLLNRALRIDEDAFGLNHASVATDLSNLAVVRVALGEPAEARRLLERALYIYEASHGPDHPEVATCLCNLAMVLRGMGDAVGARSLLERALRIDEAARGPNHPYLAIRLSGLATVSGDLGDADGARSLLERALQIDEVALGPADPLVATDLTNLAMLLLGQSDPVGARPLLERALRIDEAALGPEHPEVATDLSNLAMVLLYLGDAAGARQLLVRALAILETRLGADHPSTRMVCRSLAALADSPVEGP